LHSPEPTISADISFFLPDEAASIALAAKLAPCLSPGLVAYLEGDLGAGKTTLVRALLRALGHQGPVKSPTYTLVEVYVVSSLYWYHFDFYRFNHPEEFVDAGLGEYFRNDSVCLVEWPDKAAGFVPPPDLVVALGFEQDGRRVTLSARSPEGGQCLNIFLTTPAANSSALPEAPPSSSS
jgi:tRNA threonylcarbamoyladenosine biosynthesis protein TsaE